MHYLRIFLFFLVLLFPATSRAATWYVAMDGDDGNPGTLEEPFRTIQRALREVAPGDTVLVRAGVYDLETYVDVEGEPGSPVTLSSFPGERAVLDGSGHGPDDPIKFRVTGAFLVIRDLEFRGGPSDGVLVTDGAHDVELLRLDSHGHHLAGIALEGGAHHVSIVDCDSHDNVDLGPTAGEHADGFGIKYDIGPGVVLRGCRSWNNSDDGYDLWEAGSPVRLERCWAWGNGYDRWNIGGGFAGDGNGFKLGPGGPTVHRCISWKNARRGFEYDDATDPERVTNCTSWRNGLVGFRFREAAHFLRNNLSFEDGGLEIGPQVDDAWNSWNDPPGITVTAADFRSLDDTRATGPRNPDGTLPTGPFLAPSEGSALVDRGVDVGEWYAGRAPDLGAIEYQPSPPDLGRQPRRLEALRAAGPGCAP